MTLKNKRILGLTFIIAALAIRFTFQDVDVIPYVTGGLFGGGFVLLFGVEEEEKKP